MAVAGRIGRVALPLLLTAGLAAAEPAPGDRAGCCGGPGWGGAGYGPGYAPYRPYYPGYPPPAYGPPAYGPPAYVPPAYVPPRAWAPPVVVVPVQPPATLGRPPAEFVYWCDDPRGYYPNVTTCHGPWREVSATSPR